MHDQKAKKEFGVWLGGPHNGCLEHVPDTIQAINRVSDASQTIECPVVRNDAGVWIVWNGEEYGIWTPVISQDAHDDLACRQTLENLQAKRLIAVDCYPQTIRHRWEDRLPLQPRWALASYGWRSRVREEQP